MSKDNPRDYGTGSIYQRASDGRYIGTIEAGYTATGSRRRITVTGKTEAEAKRKLRDKRRQIEREGLPATGNRVTVKKFADDWLEQRRHTVRAKPWSSDASAVRKWIIPTIGHKKLADLTPGDLRAVAAAQRKAGLTSSTARRTHVTLTGMLRAAMIDGHQVPARVLLVKGPELSAGDLDAMPIEQIEAVMDVALRELPHWSRWLTQVLYGQRPAEVLGLTWGNVDLDRRIITIEWQLQALPWLNPADKTLGCVVPEGLRVRHLEGRWHLTAPKTKKGLRIVPMLPIVEAALREWQPIAPPNRHDLVWPALNGKPARDRDDLHEWHALQGSAEVGHPAGRPWRVYEARHAFATRLLEHGADAHVVTELMGHSSILTSRGYQHVRTEAALEALTRINERLTRPRELD